MFSFKFAIIHSDPPITKRYDEHTERKHQHVIGLSGPVVMCRKNTRCTPIWAMANIFRTCSSRREGRRFRTRRSAGTNSELVGQVRLGTGRESSNLLLSDMDAVTADSIGQAVQAVTNDPVDTLDTRCGEGFDELVSLKLCHSFQIQVVGGGDLPQLVLVWEFLRKSERANPRRVDGFR